MKAKPIPTKNSIFWASFLTLVLLLACQTVDTAGLAKTSGFSPCPSASRPILHLGLKPTCTWTHPHWA